MILCNIYITRLRTITLSCIMDVLVAKLHDIFKRFMKAHGVSLLLDLFLFIYKNKIFLIKSLID